MKRKIPAYVTCFLPALFFLLLTGALQILLRNYPIYGPVNARTGQPWIPHFPRMLFGAEVALLLACLIASLWIAGRGMKGRPRILACLGITLLVPLELLSVLLVELTLSGK